MQIKFFTAGGTIDKVYFDAKSDYEVGTPRVAEILKEARVTTDYDVEPILSKDSLDMTEEDRQLIRRRVAADPCPRAVITHGTDTMIETARRLLDLPGKTIVLTGSMQPALFRMTDAAFNIGSALAAVQCLPPGVYIVSNGRIFDPLKSRKNREKNCIEEVGNPDGAGGAADASL
ncbi:MAG: asparaginase [Pirellulales bacterium]|nr:asparaginase [Pirellulales bacterium]